VREREWQDEEEAAIAGLDTVPEYLMCLMEIKHGFFRAEEYYLLAASGVEKESWLAPCSGECSFKLIGLGAGQNY
jgi:hypothetical protein